MINRMFGCRFLVVDFSQNSITMHGDCQNSIMLYCRDYTRAMTKTDSKN